MKDKKTLLGVIIMFFWASEYCHVPYFAPYLTSLGMTSTIIGFVTGVYGFTQLVFRIPLGIFTDKNNAYKRVIEFGCLMTTLSSFGLCFATTAWFSAICRFLAGLAASTWLAFTVLYSEYHKRSENVSAMTNATGFNNAGKLMAFVIGTVIASLWGYIAPLIGSVIFGVVAFALSLKLTSVPVQRKPAIFRELFPVMKNRLVLIPALLAAAQQFISQATIFSFTSNHCKLLGANNTELGISSCIVTVTQVALSNVVGKKFVPKIGTNKAIALGFLLLALYPVLLILAPGMWLVYIAQALAGAGSILTYAVLSAKAIEYVSTEHKSTAMGVFQAVYGIGMTLGPIVTGWLAKEDDYSLAFAFCGALAALSALAAYISLNGNDKYAAKLKGEM